MNRKLFWKFLFIIATGIVALFYIINYFTTQAEEGMSQIDEKYRDEIRAWGREAEMLYHSAEPEVLKIWLHRLQQKENTKASIVSYDYEIISGDLREESYYTENQYGRSVDWPIHLHFDHLPLMEIPFERAQASFLVILPKRMVPGSHWPVIRFVMLVVLPMVLLALLSVLLYRHIMQPLSELGSATRQFSQGNLDVRVRKLMGNRNDELSELAETFDQMATRIGELIVNQRQLIADLSHELRTPLTRMEIAVDAAKNEVEVEKNLDRAEREAKHIRRLVQDSLTLAWLENERPELAKEDLDLVDLLDVIIEDARFEFPDKQIETQFPDSVILKNSNHLAVGQALENIIRNALRFTPQGEKVEIEILQFANQYMVSVNDRGPGVPEELLETIFQPFFRVDKSRQADGSSFGLGLSLARRQINTVGGSITASNRDQGGLTMVITLPVK